MGKYFKIFIINLLFCLSCMPEKSGVQDNADNFTASIETVLTDELSGWDADDEISIDGFIYKTAEGGRDAIFFPVADSAPDTEEHFAVFPADKKRYGKGIKDVCPRVIYSDNESDIPKECVIALAKSSSHSLQFKNVLSFISVDVHADGIKKISISSNGGELLSGEYTVDYSGNNLHVFVSDGNADISVQKSDGSPFIYGERVYFACLPANLKSGFTFSAESVNSVTREWTANVSSKMTFDSGQCTHLGKFYHDSTTGAGRLDISDGIKVTLDCDSRLAEPISELIFGSYSEMHGGDLIPGILEQYIVNPSFETWDSIGDKGEEKNELVFTDSEAVSQDPNVAYPWEKRILSGNVTFDMTDEDKFNTLFSQKITVTSESSAALLQRIALPLYRTSKYKVKFYAKTYGDLAVNLSFHGVGSSEKDIMSKDIYMPVISEGKWQPYEHEFILSTSPSTFNSRHRQYNLWFEVTGNGTIYIDQVTIFPSDCVEGIFNPETINHFKEYNIKAIRWPGGNYTSGYNWKNGIGLWDERPCLKNRAWGGLDPNYLGTDELMRFCELTGVEPIIGVGYNTSLITEQDIADWVEYCNGPVSSEYGAKRAANGHPEPYDVKYWGIGNEVYGTYQQGNVTASEYATGLSSIASKIKSVDKDVIIMASGRGVHNHYRGVYSGWTESLSSSSSFDVLDCHLYVYGYDKSAALSLTGEGFFRIYAAASQNLRDFIDQMRTVVPGRKLAFLEWGVLPKLSGKNNPTPQRQTFANLLLSACQYHEMIRNSDVVEMAAMHNFSFYVAPHKLHSEPVNIRTSLFKELSVVSGGYSLKIDEECFPTYAQTADMLDVGIRQEVPEVDMIAVLKDECIYVSCVNKNPSKEYTLHLDLRGAISRQISGRTYTSSRPYARSLWSDNVITSIAPVNINETGEIVLPPLSYSILQIQLK